MGHSYTPCVLILYGQHCNAISSTTPTTLDYVLSTRFCIGLEILRLCRSAPASKRPDDRVSSSPTLLCNPQCRGRAPAFCSLLRLPANKDARRCRYDERERRSIMGKLNAHPSLPYIDQSRTALHSADNGGSVMEVEQTLSRQLRMRYKYSGRMRRTI